MHIALAACSHFILAVHVGARTFQMACQLVASVRWCLKAAAASLPLPLLLVDEHRPYPQAILPVFAVVKHRRRRGGRGRPKKPGLKAPPGLLVGLVKKVRDSVGRVVKLRRRALFGTMRQINERIAELGLGRQITTSHLETGQRGGSSIGSPARRVK